jgi:tetratricopeptide (TPR) repeat protein
MAVARIAGEGGDKLESELTQALVATQRFQVLERQHIDAAVAELRFNAEGYVSDDSAMSFGEMTGAASLVVGEVQGAEYREELGTQAQKCARDGQTVDCTLYTRVARANYRVALKVVETKTGHVLAAKAVGAARERSALAYDAPPPDLAAADAMFGECRAEIVTNFARAVAPHDVTEQVALRTDDDLPALATGTNYAVVGNWAAAVEQYRAAVAQASNPPFTVQQQAAARYDLGVALGFSGAFDEGIAEIEKAYALDPDELYRSQIAALRRYKDEAARVAEQESAPAP